MDLNQSFIDKIKDFGIELKSIYPRLTFLGIIQRVESETWDLVVAGDNLDTEKDKSEIAEILSKTFLRSEMTLFSGLVVLNSNNQFVQIIRQMMGDQVLESEPGIVMNTRVGRIYIKNAYIFVASSL